MVIHKRFWFFVVCLYLAGAITVYVLLAGRYIGQVSGKMSLPALFTFSKADTPPTPSREPEPSPLHTYTELSPLEVRQLLNGNCQTIQSAGEFPDPVKKAFTTITHERLFALADPGSQFNATGTDPGLPRRRLDLAGRCDDRWFIEYEHGGTGESAAVVVLRVSADKSAAFIWGRALRVRPPVAENLPKNLDELRSVLAVSAFRDEPYRW